MVDSKDPTIIYGDAFETGMDIVITDGITESISVANVRDLTTKGFSLDINVVGNVKDSTYVYLYKIALLSTNSDREENII